LVGRKCQDIRAVGGRGSVLPQNIGRSGGVYEEKYDGWGMLAYRDGAHVTLVSQAGRDHTRRFPAHVAAIASLSPDTLIPASDGDFPCKPTFLGKILTLSEGVCRSLDTRPRRSYRCPMPLPPRLPWQPPWLTVELLLLCILHEHRSAEQWKESKKEIPGLLKERERIRKAGWWLGAVFEYRETEEVARSMRVEFQSIELSDPGELDRALSTVKSGHAEALMVSSGNPVTFEKRADLIGFVLRNRLPSVYGVRAYVDEGGLMSYGPSLRSMFRRAATYVDKILKGAKLPTSPWSSRPNSNW